MARCIYIVQGEGRGHMSQAIALSEILQKAGHTLEALFVGAGAGPGVPGYMSDRFQGKLHYFHSPYFLKTPNRKGIYVGKTIGFNLARSFIYLREVRRIRKEILRRQPDVVFNFYDVVGALAMKRLPPSIKRIGIGHHFYLHLNGYECQGGMQLHRRLLSWHSRLIMQSCNRVLALSFRKEEGSGKIEVIPPLVRNDFRLIKHEPGNRFLVYLLNDGYIYDLILLARKDPEFKADLFTSLDPEVEMPEGIRIYPYSDEKFREKMASCRGIIATAGFDTAAEAAYHGIPLAVIPARNHFEQRCNGVDIERNGIGTKLLAFESVIIDNLQTFDFTAYRIWVNNAEELILKSMME